MKFYKNFSFAFLTSLLLAGVELTFSPTQVLAQTVLFSDNFGSTSIDANSTGAPLISDYYHFNYQGFKTLGGRMAKTTRDVLGLNQ